MVACKATLLRFFLIIGSRGIASQARFRKTIILSTCSSGMHFFALLSSEQRLIIMEQHFIDFKNIVAPLCNTALYNYIKEDAV